MTQQLHETKIESPIDKLRQRLKVHQISRLAVQGELGEAAALLTQGTGIKVQLHETEADAIAAANRSSSGHNITASLVAVGEHNSIEDEHYIAVCQARRLVAERIPGHLLAAEESIDPTSQSQVSGYIVAVSRGPAFN